MQQAALRETELHVQSSGNCSRSVGKSYTAQCAWFGLNLNRLKKKGFSLNKLLAQQLLE
jgi:hypothetical protein